MFKKIFRYLRYNSVIKTIWFNYHYLPLSQAIHLPISICRNTKLSRMKGEVVLNGIVKFSMISIGKYGVGTLDMKYERTIWQNNGTVVFDGRASIGSGTKISVNKGGIIRFGNNFCVTGGSSIICSKEISFGNECLLSWDILVMDTDFHNILSKEDSRILNEPKPIHIGDRVWIGCRNTILKGVTISNDVVIAAGSKITKDITTPHSIVGGTDTQKVLKENISWRE